MNLASTSTQGNDRGNNDPNALPKNAVPLLESLQRPLEDHWAFKFKYALDPKTSDYIYKHHITHLEDIYQNHKFEEALSDPPKRLPMTPVAQLYGTNGLKSSRPIQKQVEKARESKWVSNFQKYRVLDPPVLEKKRHEVKEHRPKSPVHSEGDAPRSPSNNEYDNEEGYEYPHFSRRSKNPQISDTDLIMFGLYKLNPRQEEIYNQFVQMISEFSNFDMANIVEDAFQDARAESNGGIDEYGGTSLEESL